MKIEEISKTIISCAIEYEKNLENKNILFAFSQNNYISFLETKFLSRNFLHLTGVKTKLNSVDFYDKSLKKELSKKDYFIHKLDIVEKKLLILSQIINIHKTAKMIGDYHNGNKFLLETEKLLGTVHFCLGFVKDGDYYVPNSSINEDIRNITYKPQQKILLSFRKNIKEEKYNELCYKNKDLDKFQVSEDLIKKINSNICKELFSENLINKTIQKESLNNLINMVKSEKKNIEFKLKEKKKDIDLIR